MPTKVTDSHRNEGGEQVTTRTVAVTDAKNETTNYEFEQAHPLESTGWEHVGDNDPTDTALEAARDGPDGSDDA